MDITFTHAHDKRKMLDMLSCVLYTVEKPCYSSSGWNPKWSTISLPDALTVSDGGTRRAFLSAAASSDLLSDLRWWGRPAGPPEQQFRPDPRPAGPFHSKLGAAMPFS